MRYYSQLDSLRCYAVFWVVFVHLPLFNLSPFLKSFFDYLPGVQLFFCISGFLITSIVLQNSHFKTAHFFKSFYVRRFLRIFPIYYLVIFFLFLFNIQGYRNGWFIYDFFYVSNIKLGLEGNFDSNVISPHFWSLAVEEQFYLLWPGLLFFAPRKNQAYFLGAIFFFIGALSILFYGSFFVLRTIGCLSYLGSGCLLGILYYYHSDFFLTCKNIFSLIFGALIVLLLLASMQGMNLATDLKMLLTIVAIPVIVLKFILGFENPFLKKIFENRVIIYMGKISYGIYVYHMFALFPLLVIQKIFGFAIRGDFFIALVKIIIALAISIISWELFEKRMNKLKDLFSYT